MKDNRVFCAAFELMTEGLSLEPVREVRVVGIALN